MRIAGLSLLVVAGWAGRSAVAQTPAQQGAAIYQNGIPAGTGVTARPACAICHGTDPHRANNGATLAAGNPALLLNAFNSPTMSTYDYGAVIDATGRTAIATYLLYPEAATQPYSALSTGTLDFGTLNVGASATKAVTVTNVGPAALTGAVVQANPSAVGVTQTNDCGATLAPLAACTITVTFAPTAAGTFNGGFVYNAANDADPNAGRTFFVYASAASASAPAPAPAASGGGGAMGAVELALAALAALTGALRGSGRARVPGRRRGSPHREALVAARTMSG